MKEIVLRPKGRPGIPVEAESITPDLFAGRGVSEIEKLQVYSGNRIRSIGDYFEVEGEAAEKAGDQLVTVDGDVPWAKYVGARMTGGRLVVRGSVGMHAGAQMAGGELTVEGSASDWAGAEMEGGQLRIGGEAGDLLGSAYRGSREGMRGGCIIVEGGVGGEAGSFMRRGLIVALGGVGSFAGAHLDGGSIFVFGRASKRLGAMMRGNGGFIACLGEVEPLLSTFAYETSYSPGFMRIHLRLLSEKLGVSRAGGFVDASFRRYRGDAAAGGNGEILVVDSKG